MRALCRNSSWEPWVSFAVKGKQRPPESIFSNLPGAFGEIRDAVPEHWANVVVQYRRENGKTRLTPAPGLTCHQVGESQTAFHLLFSDTSETETLWPEREVLWPCPLRGPVSLEFALGEPQGRRCPWGGRRPHWWDPHHQPHSCPSRHKPASELFIFWRARKKKKIKWTEMRQDLGGISKDGFRFQGVLRHQENIDSFRIFIGFFTKSTLWWI